MKLIGFYDHYEYEEYPLAFIPLHNLTDTQKVSLLLLVLGPRLRLSH